jgi:Electron transfer DM13
MALRILSVPAVMALFLLGLWLFAGVVSNDFELSMALTAGWFALAGAAAVFVGWRRRDLRIPVVGTFLVTAAVVGGFLAWTTLRDKTVTERVATGTPVAAGAFVGVAHPTSGRAAIVETDAGERKLTLTGFETDAGPDLFVYLVAGGDPEAVDDHRSLGSLKGNKGNQQYTIPAGADISKYDTVVIWCRAFSVAFGAATLASA